MELREHIQSCSVKKINQWYKIKEDSIAISVPIETQQSIQKAITGPLM